MWNRVGEMKRGSIQSQFIIVALAGACAFASFASAKTVDLTLANSHGEANGAHFFWTAAHPTGSGVIQSFLRIGSNEGEIEGYNTDAKSYQFDEKGGGFTHSLLISDIPQVNGYFQFLLDINQRSSVPDSLLSMHELVFFRGSKNDVNEFDSASQTFADDPGAVKAWDLDAGPDGNSVVEMDYGLNPGSGWGDVIVYVPVSLFTGTGEYLYLYSAFGVPNPNNAGYEEWAVMGDGGDPQGGPVPPATPLPLAAAGGLVLLATIGAGNRRNRISV